MNYVKLDKLAKMLGDVAVLLAEVKQIHEESAKLYLELLKDIEPETLNVSNVLRKD